MKYQLIKVNLQETILVIKGSVDRVDLVIACYSKHTGIITILEKYWNHWNHVEKIEAYFKETLKITSPIKLAICDGFGIEFN